MSRTHRVATCGAQHLTHRAIVRDGIRGGFDCRKPILAFVVGHKPAAQVHLWLVVILYIVLAKRRSLPDIEQRALDGLALRIGYAPSYNGRLALFKFWATRNICAMFE